MQAQPLWLRSAKAQAPPPLVPHHQSHPKPHKPPAPHFQQKPQAGPQSKSHTAARTHAHDGVVATAWTGAAQQQQQQQQQQQRQLHSYQQDGQQQVMSSTAGLSAKPVLPVFGQTHTAAAAQMSAQQSTVAQPSHTARSLQGHSYASGQAHMLVQPPCPACEPPGGTSTVAGAPPQRPQLPAQLPRQLHPQVPQAHAYPCPLSDLNPPARPYTPRPPTAGTTPVMLSKQAAAHATAAVAASSPVQGLSVPQLSGGHPGVQAAGKDESARQSEVKVQAPSPAQPLAQHKQQVCFQPCTSNHRGTSCSETCSRLVLAIMSSALQGHVGTAAAAAPAVPKAALAAAPTGAAASAAAKAVAQAPSPQPAQPTPVVKMEPAHKKLESYLPGELCEAFRTSGLKHDLYDWQVTIMTLFGGPLYMGSIRVQVWVCLVCIAFGG